MHGDIHTSYAVCNWRDAADQRIHQGPGGGGKGLVGPTEAKTCIGHLNKQLRSRKESTLPRLGRQQLRVSMKPFEFVPGSGAWSWGPLVPACRAAASSAQKSGGRADAGCPATGSYAVA